MDHLDTFDPRPARFPDLIPGVRAPRGLRDRARRAAAAQGVTFGEFVRRAVEERVAATPGGDGPDTFDPAPGARIAA